MNSVLPLRARNVSASRAFLFFLATIGALWGAAQVVRPETGESDATISVDVRLVAIHATVRDKTGHTVPSLQEHNLRVFEDGLPQTIRVFHHADVPVAVGLVIDNSGSMRDKRSGVSAAAVAFARSSNPRDEMFIANFNEHVTLGLPDTKLFSASAAELEGAILSPVPAGRTALYDAIGEALTHLQKSTNESKVLLVFTDGRDNASKRSLQDVLAEIGRSDATIYTIGLLDSGDLDLDSPVLKRIAATSGGEAFLPNQAAEAVRICRMIAKDIRTQYDISWSPSNPTYDGRYRTIKVTARGDDGARLQVRTRAGYFASPNARNDKDGLR